MQQFELEPKWTKQKLWDIGLKKLGNYTIPLKTNLKLVVEEMNKVAPLKEFNVDRSLLESVCFNFSQFQILKLDVA